MGMYFAITIVFLFWFGLGFFLLGFSLKMHTLRYLRANLCLRNNISVLEFQSKGFMSQVQWSAT